MYRGFTRVTCLICSWLSLGAASGAGLRQDVPALPHLALETFPPSARATIGGARDAALKRPNDPAAVGALARALHAWEQWELAHDAYARAQALEPERAEWWYLDGVVLQRSARHEEAALRLRRAVAAAPDFRPARVRLADTLLDAGRLDESRTIYQELAADPATEPMGLFGLGRIAAAERRHEQAITHLERAVGLFPEWGAAHYALALSYRALGRRDDAARALERHTQYGPRWPALDDPPLAAVAAVRDDGRALLQRGIALAGRGDLEGAIETHEAALVKDPGLAQAHGNLISLYGQKRDWARAEAHYRELLKRGVDLGDAHYDYGVLLGMQGRWDDAAAAYRAALGANPLHARASNNLGEVLERQGKLDEAAAAYHQAVTAQPSFRLARFNHARMLIARRQIDDAIAELEKIVEPRDAEAPRYLFALAAVHVRAGRKDEGLKRAAEARALAVSFGQSDLVASIDRDLARLR